MPLSDDSFTGCYLRFLPDTVPQNDKEKAVYYVLSLLCDDWQENGLELITWSVLKAILFKKNPTFIAMMRNTLKQGFLNVFHQLNAMEMNAETLLQAQVFIRNCMSFIPYTEPAEGELFSLPQWMDDHWEFVQYRMHPIEMTNLKSCNSFFQQKQDRFFAYAMEPVYHPSAHPQLVFTASSYPAGTGFWIAVKSDLTPNTMIGENLYKSGRQKLIDWLDGQVRPVDVSSISLGASLALQLAMDQGHKLDVVHAYSPAGMPLCKTLDWDHWEQLSHKPQVMVVRQGDDPVSQYGTFKNDWTMLYLKPSKKNRNFLSVLDHATNFAGLDDTTFSFQDVDKQNQANLLRNIVLYGAGRSLLYYFAVLPYHYNVRPFLHLKEHVSCHNQQETSCMNP
jgi:hypothetical protein